ncbi:MAG TPA: hypothetical protein PLS46_09875, partial [Microthrixaceae bacterium]|nr:hypothetical protein [Microthrixaceae bacterium]
MSPIDATDVFELSDATSTSWRVSFAEQALVDLLEAELRTLPHLEVTRVGDNVVARTQLGRDQRL